MPPQVLVQGFGFDLSNCREEIGQQDTATPLKVPRKRKLNPDKHGSLGVKGKKIKKEAVAGKKGKKKKAGKRVGRAKAPPSFDTEFALG